MIIDNFLECFEDVKSLAKDGVFKDEKNTYDGVVYPEICRDIPNCIAQEVEENLSKVIGKNIEISAMFLRRSPEDAECPNKVHHDLSMGQYSLMLYVNEREDMGTSFVVHRSTGIGYAPEARDFVSIIAADSNNDGAWREIEFTQSKENRALIFESERMHRAEPIGGFGKGSESRTVLTCFFWCKE